MLELIYDVRNFCHFRHLLAHLADRMDLDGEGLRYFMQSCFLTDAS